MERKAEERPLVSVVMAVYNDDLFVADAINSILDQTFRDFEFLIINDGSTDRSADIIAQFCDDSRIRVFHQENRGLTGSLNTGIALAQGTYIARQDADDISFPRRLEEQIQFLEENPDIALVGTSIAIMDDHNAFAGYRSLPAENAVLQHELMRQNCFIHGSILMRKGVVDMVGGYREELLYAEDHDLWLRIAERFKVANLPHILYSYRWGAYNISQQKKDIQEQYLEIAKLLAWQRRCEGEDLLMRQGSSAFFHEYRDLLTALPV